jgi:hypothetical protein
VVERCHTISELQNLSVVNRIDFRRPNGCHHISDKIDVTSLTVQIANDSLADIELVEGKVYSQPLMLLGRTVLLNVR